MEQNNNTKRDNIDIKKTQTSTIISFVCGLLGVFLSELAFPALIVGIITGIIALKKYDPEKNKSKGLAIAGLVLSIMYALLACYKFGRAIH